MDAGHFTGFGRTLLEEDAAVQTSMGPILDRTKEHLPPATPPSRTPAGSSSTRWRAVDAGELPPGSARTPGGVRMPQRARGCARRGQRWEDVALDQITG